MDPLSCFWKKWHEYLPTYSLHSYTNNDMNSMNSEFGFDEYWKIIGNGERNTLDN